MMDWLASVWKGLRTSKSRKRDLSTIRKIDTAEVVKPIVWKPDMPFAKEHQKALEYFETARKPYQRIVVWGLFSQLHTHRFIHKHFYETLQKLSVSEVYWVDDAPENRSLLTPGTFVIAMNQACKYLVYVQGVYYCTHNIMHPEERLQRHNILQLQVFTNQMKETTTTEYWNSTTVFDKETKHLYQPWGTDLLPVEFLSPVFPESSEVVYWIGSIWNNAENQGNLDAIETLKKALERHHLRLEHKEYCTVEENIHLVRSSRLSPAFSGTFQTKVDYLPCRVFKNVSYGMPAMTNIAAFQKVFEDADVFQSDIKLCVDTFMELDAMEWKKKVQKQQESVASQHTYLHKWAMLFKAMNTLYS
jgi:hypothetical protein